MRRALVILTVALSLAGTMSCARRPLRGTAAPALDRKLSTFAWIEEGDLATLIADTRSTQYREKAPYIPLEICVANRSLKSMTLTRESFVLVDAEGNRYPAAGPKELLQGYDYLDLDRNLQEIADLVFNRFATFTRYPSKFSPTRQNRPGESALVRDQVTLPKFGYFIDYLYFPTPKSGVKGRKFELIMSAPELEQPIFVKFQVL